MHIHWDEVCSLLGQPCIVNAQDYSFTKRNRAYWHNFSKPIVLPDHSTMGPNVCMDAGRRIQPCAAYSRECVRPLGSSWRGNPALPYANTRLPVLVDDELFDEPQHLRPEEAGRLHGLRT